MGSFNYKKWIAENKYGKKYAEDVYGKGSLNEQEETTTYYGCGFGPATFSNTSAYTTTPFEEGDMVYGFLPVVEYQLQTSLISDTSLGQILPDGVYNPNSAEYGGDWPLNGVGDVDPFIFTYLYTSSYIASAQCPSGSVDDNEGQGVQETYQYYGCSTCPEGNPYAGQAGCTPMVPVEMSYDAIESELNSNYAGDYYFLYQWEVDIPSPHYKLVSADGVINQETSQVATWDATTDAPSTFSSLIYCQSGSIDTGSVDDTEETIDIDYTNPEDYFTNPEDFCADNPDNEYDVFWFVNTTNMCEQCMNDPAQAVNIQCCCCPEYQGLPQSYIDQYPDPSILPNGWASWGGPNQCDGSVIPPTGQPTGSAQGMAVAPPPPSTMGSKDKFKPKPKPKPVRGRERGRGREDRQQRQRIRETIRRMIRKGLQ